MLSSRHSGRLRRHRHRATARALRGLRSYRKCTSPGWRDGRPIRRIGIRGHASWPCLRRHGCGGRPGDSARRYSCGWRRARRRPSTPGRRGRCRARSRQWARVHDCFMLNVGVREWRRASVVRWLICRCSRNRRRSPWTGCRVRRAIRLGSKVS